MAKEDKTKNFVDAVITKIGKDNNTAFGAVLRRADNPDTEYQSWEYLALWCNIERNKERKAYALIGAAIARAKLSADGTLGIGQAIAHCYADEGGFNGNKKDAAKVKLYRLLVCKHTEEACTILRPLLRLITSRNIPLHYAELLQDLLYSDEWFNRKIKLKWAKDFYSKKFSSQKEEK
ncbi:MAG: type I-E CRISPR-associated protein Cse2/CasB [Treponema sp.]|jgi:CRISPR system Cascade subunit CasB|nr:type I-E CRISPR-associated protein Cse2/CasB [Treponema sp.]